MQAILIHNPTAGNGEHEKNKLKKLIEAAGYEVKYYSTDISGWERFWKRKADIIFVAGGDGTVQKLAKELLKADPEAQKIPVQVMPLGTANNIAATLRLGKNPEELIGLKKTTGFDIGEVSGAGEAGLFIEGMGFGIFPKLVKVMKAKKEEEGEIEDPEAELELSLRELLKIIESYEAGDAIVIADGEEEISGKFLLVELMNVRFIGPHFELAPHAKPGDGGFELVAIPEDAREDLQQYVQQLLSGDNRGISLENFAHLRKVKEVRLKWQGKDVHIDDERIEDYSGQEIRVKNRQGVFTFRIPG